MKRLFTLLSASLLCTAISAQTMKVYRGHVITAVPAATAADMKFTAEGKLSVMGNLFATSEIDSITFDRSTIKANTLNVAYAPNNTWVTVSADMAPHVAITLKGDHVSVVADADVAEEYTYALAGSSNNGSFYMDGQYKSTINLSALNLTNPDSAAICIDNGKRIKVELTNGNSTLADGAANPRKACFFINGHAEFSGNASLTLTGNAKHAYASDEYTLIQMDEGQGITINHAANDGMHIDQYLQMDSGSLNISGTAGDGIDVSVTKDATDEHNGEVIINGGSITLAVSANDVKGIKSESHTTINGGSINANVSGNGSKGISVGGNLLISQAEGATTSIEMTVSGTTYKFTNPTTGLADSSKCRGIKVTGNYTLAGGTIHMTVTGVKAKGISCDGIYTKTGGTTNVIPE